MLGEVQLFVSVEALYAILRLVDFRMVHLRKQEFANGGVAKQREIDEAVELFKLRHHVQSHIDRINSIGC